MKNAVEYWMRKGMVIVVSQLMKITPALLICEPLCHDPAAVDTHTIKQGSSSFCWWGRTRKLPLCAGLWHSLLWEIIYALTLLSCNSKYTRHTKLTPISECVSVGVAEFERSKPVPMDFKIFKQCWSWSSEDECKAVQVSIRQFILFLKYGDPKGAEAFVEWKVT